MAVALNESRKPPGQHLVENRTPVGSQIGPKCQLCKCQGSLSVDEISGYPKITRPLFIVPECGHSLCKRCREKVGKMDIVI